MARKAKKTEVAHARAFRHMKHHPAEPNDAQPAGHDDDDVENKCGYEGGINCCWSKDSDYALDCDSDWSDGDESVVELEGEELEQNLTALRAEVKALRCLTKYEECNAKAAHDREREHIAAKKFNVPQVSMMQNWVAQAPKAHTKPTVEKWPHTHLESAGNPALHESLAHISGYLSDLSMDTEDEEDTTKAEKWKRQLDNLTAALQDIEKEEFMGSKQNEPTPSKVILLWLSKMDEISLMHPSMLQNHMALHQDGVEGSSTAGLGPG
ncbi:hypothetical protein BDR05DRAFT_952949 [Suillus weaverae]|nr:hypothetical protein BDR05DRAFT_952949 [Suillus weaverae]